MGFDLDAMMNQTQKKPLSSPTYKPSTQLEHSVTGGGNTNSNQTSQNHTDQKTTLPPKRPVTSDNESDNNTNKSDAKTKQSEETKSKSKRSVPTVVTKKSMEDKVSLHHNDTAFIKDFPKDLLNIAKKEFPDANNQTDALAAYIYVKSGRQGEVSDSVKELVKNYDGDMTLYNMEQRLSNIESMFSSLFMLLNELELGISYLSFDRLGFRKHIPKNPSSIDFLEMGIFDVINQLRKQAEDKKYREERKKGRPIR